MRPGRGLLSDIRKNVTRQGVAKDKPYIAAFPQRPTKQVGAAKIHPTGKAKCL
jgi:hypothetical protein